MEHPLRPAKEAVLVDHIAYIRFAHNKDTAHSVQASSYIFRCTHPGCARRDICCKPDEHIVNMITPPMTGTFLSEPSATTQGPLREPGYALTRRELSRDRFSKGNRRFG